MQVKLSGTRGALKAAGGGRPVGQPDPLVRLLESASFQVRLTSHGAGALVLLESKRTSKAREG
jgi:hypothetical protein